MLAHGLESISEGVALLIVLLAAIGLAVAIFHGPPIQSLVLSILALVVGSGLALAAVYAFSRPEPRFNTVDSGSVPVILALACAPCALGCIGLLLWFRRKKH